MRKNNSLKIYFFYFIFVYTFLFFTNTHFSYEDSLKFGGADGFSYMSIFKEKLFITSEKPMSIHSERFFSIHNHLVSMTFKMDFYLSYKIFVLIT